MHTQKLKMYFSPLLSQSQNYIYKRSKRQSSRKCGGKDEMLIES